MKFFKSFEASAFAGFTLIFLSTLAGTFLLSYLFNLSTIVSAVLTYIILGTAVILLFPFIFSQLKKMLNSFIEILIKEKDLTKKVPVTDGGILGNFQSQINQLISELSIILKSNAENAIAASYASASLYHIIRGLVKNIDEQCNYAAKVSSDAEKLSESIRIAASNVEVLFKSIDNSSASIQEMSYSVEEVLNNVDSLFKAIEITSSAIEQMSAAVKEVGSNVDSLVKLASDLAVFLIQMNSGIKNIDNSAKSSSDISIEVAKTAQEGFQIISRAVDGMYSIKESAHTTSDVVNKLVERTKEIDKILNVIEELTDQTNLLALNASILAAQAKEEGKGFAVVANEIKELADRTDSSTKEIAKIIENIKKETINVSSLAKDSSQKVEEGFSLFEVSKNAFQEIYDKVESSTKLSKNIAEETAVQFEASHKATKLIEDVEAMTKKINTAMREQGKAGEQISESSETVRKMATHLKKAMTEQANESRHIVRESSKINEMGKNISGAVKIQSSTTENIYKEIEKIHVVSESLTSGVHQVSDSFSKVMTFNENIENSILTYNIGIIHNKAINYCIQLTKDVNSIIISAIHERKISDSDLFDNNYMEIAGTDPKKFNTKTDSFFDLSVQPLLEKYLELDHHIDYAIILDRNGYAPTHNKKYSKSLTGNYETDLAGNRAKRIYKNEIVLKTVKSRETFLIQTYPRDTGEVFYHISAPIFFKNSYWGAAVIGYLPKK